MCLAPKSRSRASTTARQRGCAWPPARVTSRRRRGGPRRRPRGRMTTTSRQAENSAADVTGQEQPVRGTRSQKGVGRLGPIGRTSCCRLTDGRRAETAGAVWEPPLSGGVLAVAVSEDDRGGRGLHRLLSGGRLPRMRAEALRRFSGGLAEALRQGPRNEV